MRTPTILATLGLLGLAACATDPIQTNTDDPADPDAGGGGGGGGGGGADAAPTSNRVTDGLVAFYDFDGVTGQTLVKDTSGVGAALDLTIGDPLAATWGDGFLTVTAPVLIQSAGPATKIYDACSGSNAVTVEAWVKPATLDTGRPDRLERGRRERAQLPAQAAGRLLPGPGPHVGERPGRDAGLDVVARHGADRRRPARHLHPHVDRQRRPVHQQDQAGAVLEPRDADELGRDLFAHDRERAVG
jgi:hypothetical protein